MSRSSYSDECEHLELYRGNVERSIKGKKGQARLKELRDALLAMPVKALARYQFADGTKEQPVVCALGAWASAKNDGDPQAAKTMVPSHSWSDEGPDDYETSGALAKYGWPELVVHEVIAINEDMWRRDETDEQRYVRILKWVEAQILP